jgi:hypothetical protein
MRWIKDVDLNAAVNSLFGRFCDSRDSKLA